MECVIGLLVHQNKHLPMHAALLIMFTILHISISDNKGLHCKPVSIEAIYIDDIEKNIMIKAEELRTVTGGVWVSDTVCAFSCRARCG